MERKTNRALWLILALSLSTPVSAATIYNYERGAGVFGGHSGLSYDSVSASFNTGSGQFTFAVDYNGATADGGWLVISPGPNPKGVTNELGIAYFDAQSGDAWIYAYNGANNTSSYLGMPFLGYFANAYTTIDDIATLSFDASSVNATLETGFAFGNRIGIWFHPSANISTNGDEYGLENFSASQNGWLDTSFDGNCNNPNNGCVTTSIPEPGTLALLGLGLAVIGLRRHLQ